MRYGWMAAAFCAVLTVSSCVTADQPPEPLAAPAASAWREIAGSPLTAREAALGLWTGREVLLIGGSDAAACPPDADCPTDPSPLRDGAALDPGSGRWRRLADAPVPILHTRGVIVGSVAYLIPNDRHQRLLTYDVVKDTWRWLPAPFGGDGGYALAAAGDRLVAYLGSHETRSGPDYLLDPEAGTWTPIPADPLGAAFDRVMAWTGRELVLFDHELTGDPGAGKPSLTRAAVLDLSTRAWRRLPDSAMLATGPWIVADGNLTNPALGGADGGEVGNWGRTYPNGGTVNPATGSWSALPRPPDGAAAQSAGARAATTAVYTAASGWVLDTATGAWWQVPPVPGGGVTGLTVVAAGTDMLIFGGARWDRSRTAATLVDDVRVWTPEG